MTHAIHEIHEDTDLISKTERTKGESHLLTQIPEKDEGMFFFSL